ncbi:hypothetical protein DPMN_101253 [Dreissena polymorpha]|uniref:Uncharacterized protein n=1 Tax=Dreissena polymorpha TaxID=45954 RepID=A0A9D4LIE0_DREPO|nr:hypothetical protein DPMN_101253 [Dreissena polymorpha]
MYNRESSDDSAITAIQSERIGQWATPQTIADMAELSEVSRLNGDPHRRCGVAHCPKRSDSIVIHRLNRDTSAISDSSVR